jgi:uncharacterized protein involved in exopolysaccharide biosynthesis
MTDVTPPQTEDAEDEGGFDLQKILGWVTYTVRAVRQRWRLAAAGFTLVLVGSAALVMMLPRVYSVNTSILAQRSQVIAALSNPSRQGFGDSDAPTRSAADAILRRDNLLSLIKQTGLQKSWEQTRTPAGRLRDTIRRLLSGPLNDEERLDALADLLERRLYVNTSDTKIVIGINWPDAQMAYRLVEAAEQNFLESRHVTEISLIAESISILESHSAVAREAVEAALEDVRRRPPARAAGLTPSAAPAAPSTPADQEVARLGVMLVAKRRALRDLEDYRRRRLSELQTQLAEQKAVYSDSHPNVVNIDESIKGLMVDSPQLVTLRREEQELENEYRRRGGPRLPDEEPAASAGSVRPVILEPLSADRGGKTDVGDDYARQRLSAAVSRYNMLLDRIASAKVEADAARAAFKYRYIVVRPPKLPSRPISPHAALMLLAGAMAGAGLGIVVALGAEVRRGLVVQPWQVRSLLDTPILAEVQR